MLTASSLVSWKTIAILLALINLKTLPFSWHARLLYRFLRNWYHPNRVRRTIKEAAEQGAIHPIFASESIFSHAPAYETDYNLHKSNSTYFSDLDESRTQLVTKLFGPALRSGERQLEKEGHKGRTNVILGSVHTSFHKEIKPYEGYELRSRVLGWDKKWLVIGSWFIRPAKNGRAEVLLASSLSKYVVKKGRFTVSPERCLTTAQWLPPRPAKSQSGAGEGRESSEGSELPTPLGDTPVELQATPGSEPDSIAAPVPETVVRSAQVVEKLENAAAQIHNDEQSTIEVSRTPRAVEWDWHRIEMERVRGLQIVSNWLSLDKELIEEHVHELRRDGVGSEGASL